MADQTGPSHPPISLSAIREMDELGRSFRRRLRQVAIQLSLEANPSSPSVTSEVIAQAAQVVGRQLASQASSGSGSEKDCHERRPKVA